MRTAVSLPWDWEGCVKTKESFSITSRDSCLKILGLAPPQKCSVGTGHLFWASSRRTAICDCAAFLSLGIHGLKATLHNVSQQLRGCCKRPNPVTSIYARDGRKADKTWLCHFTLAIRPRPFQNDINQTHKKNLTCSPKLQTHKFFASLW